MIPKDSKCAQKLSKTVLNITTEVHATVEETEEKINNKESGGKFYENISTYSTKEEISISKMVTSPPLEKKDTLDLGKPRSMSDGTLRCNRTPKNTPLPKDDDPVLTKVDTHQSKSDIIKTILNMLPSELITNKRQNSVHPMAPNTSSEDSGISIDNSAPLQQNVLQCPSEDESEESSESSRQLGSSVLSLRGLFGGNSSQSSTTTNKDTIPSPKEGFASRPQSLTSSSSSAGYDNLAFVPVDILSRRSSIFSDASC